MADICSEGEGGKVGARNGASGREIALTGGKTRGSTSVVSVRNVNQSSPGGNTQAGTESREGQEQHGHDQLLPGLADHMTLDLITTKLSWTDVLVLPSISHAWRHAVHTRQVHDARVRAQATKTLHVFLVDIWGNSLGVHSTGDKHRCCRALPPIKKEDCWFLSVLPSDYSLFASDGRIYVVGTDTWPARLPSQPDHPNTSGTQFRSKSFSLDLAGRKQWTECVNEPVRPRSCEFFRDGNCKPVYKCLASVAI